MTVRSKYLLRKSLLLIALTLCSTAGAHDDENWPPSKFGASDEIGAANLITAESVIQASRLVRTGKTYALAIPTSAEVPAYAPRSFNLTIVQPGQIAGSSLGPNKATYNDDIVNAWVAIGTQIDGLGHVGIDHVYYNGLKAKDFVETTGLKKLGAEKIPPIVTRGVLLDMATYFGVDIVKEGVAFNKAEIEGAARRQGIELRRGDVVLFHTGWLSLIGKDNARFAQGEPGLGREGAKFLTDLGVVAVGADTWAVEVVPFEQGAGVFEVHQHLLAKHGTYILEYIKTDELARDKAWEFLFVLGAPRVKGSVQAGINPIAIR